MYLFIVMPIFLAAVFFGVKSWLWRIILIAIVAGTWYFWGPISLAVAVAFIIGIAFMNSLAKINKSKL